MAWGKRARCASGALVAAGWLGASSFVGCSQVLGIDSNRYLAEDATTPPVDAAADAPKETGAPDAPPDAPPPPPCKNTTTSCGAPGHCVDCTGSSQGSQCVSGRCGCIGPSDCPQGVACASTSATCTTSTSTLDCNGYQPCNGGCCSMNTCVADCSMAPEGKVCLAPCPVSGTRSEICCGCQTNADCPTGETCNTLNYHCQ